MGRRRTALLVALALVLGAPMAHAQTLAQVLRLRHATIDPRWQRCACTLNSQPFVLDLGAADFACGPDRCVDASATVTIGQTYALQIACVRPSPAPLETPTRGNVVQYVAHLGSPSVVLSPPTPGPTPTLPYRDDFARTLLGSSWVQVAGGPDCAINAGMLQSNNLPAGSADCYVNAKLGIPAYARGHFAKVGVQGNKGALGLAIDQANLVGCFLDGPANWALYAWINNAGTTIARGTLTAPLAARDELGIEQLTATSFRCSIRRAGQSAWTPLSAAASVQGATAHGGGVSLVNQGMTFEDVEVGNGLLPIAQTTATPVPLPTRTPVPTLTTSLRTATPKPTATACYTRVSVPCATP
jgi:hypothetical protein